jgi:hypothetical protein
MQNHTKKFMGVIRGRSESFGITFDYYGVRMGKTVARLEYGIVGIENQQS